MASTVPISPRSMPRRVTSRTSSAPAALFKATRVVRARSMTDAERSSNASDACETAADGGVEVERATKNTVTGAKVRIEARRAGCGGKGCRLCGAKDPGVSRRVLPEGRGWQRAPRPRRCGLRRRERARRTRAVGSCRARCRDCRRRSPCLRAKPAARAAAPLGRARSERLSGDVLSSAKASLTTLLVVACTRADWRPHRANDGAARSGRRGCGKRRRGRGHCGCTGTAARPCPSFLAR